METVEVVPYLVEYGNRLLTECLLPKGVPLQDVRTMVLISFEGVPCLYTAGTGILPDEFGSMLRRSTITELNGNGYRLSWDRIRKMIPKKFKPDWLPQTPTC